ncbi:MAG: ATP/GTP-binding protein [Candidatus Tritonobacter lacicola]|nr:ATP/GTP-binding protein [Candidatus Tritonobacter lacicola]
MIIKFTVENWMSFREPATFSMIASRERQHGERLAKVKKYQMRLLPVAAVYGGNASGKTNFFKAINFVRNLVVKGTQPDGVIPIQPFRLDSRCASQPSRFSFQILIDETIYEFSFTATLKKIMEEKLVCISSTSERVLYHRKNGKPVFDNALEGQQFLQFAFQGTRDNQLFLTNSVTQKVEHFKPVYDWFKNTIVLIAPDARFGPFEQFFQEEHPLYPAMNDTLAQLDTGITHLGGDEINFENLAIPDSIKEKLQEDMPEGDTVQALAGPGNDRFIITRKDGKLIAQKLVTYHKDKDGKAIKFEMRHESDGSQRAIDLVPAFLDLAARGPSRVYIIDEIDRSLHSLLTRRLIQAFLNSCNKESRSQLLFTTHDVLLMDQKLLRRDEMWVTERDREGSSTLFSFSEFKDVRYDKDIRKSYLQGRMGGVPRILLYDLIDSADENARNKGEKN